MTTKTILKTNEPAGVSLQLLPNPAQRILVVEDNADVRQVCCEVLTDYGYRVDTAEDGATGWKALHFASYGPDSYDLLITDNDMPKVTGVELLLRLRAALIALPVIMATGTVPKKDFTRYSWLQPTVTLLKPYTFEELLGTVKEVLRETAGAPADITPLLDWQSQPTEVVPWKNEVNNVKRNACYE